VLGDRDDVGARDLRDGDLALVGRVQVDVAGCQRRTALVYSLGSNTSSDAELEVLGLVHNLLSEVGGVEGGGDENVGVDNVLLELRLGALLVVGDDQPECQLGAWRNKQEQEARS
jgi:hypothetical protein